MYKCIDSYFNFLTSKLAKKYPASQQEWKLIKNQFVFLTLLFPVFVNKTNWGEFSLKENRKSTYDICRQITFLAKIICVFPQKNNIKFTDSC